MELGTPSDQLVPPSHLPEAALVKTLSCMTCAEANDADSISKLTSSLSMSLVFMIFPDYLQIIFTGSGYGRMVGRMSEIAIPVADAAKDFLKLLDRVERKRESAVLLREGRPVATLSPVPGAALTCADLAERWPRMEKLSADEAGAFADDLERARTNLPPLKAAWD
jgi:antitoxin (DNA-binding transcriptional repressor) of toxin-antitoxin stability system